MWRLLPGQFVTTGWDKHADKMRMRKKRGARKVFLLQGEGTQEPNSQEDSENNIERKRAKQQRAMCTEAARTKQVAKARKLAIQKEQITEAVVSKCARKLQTRREGASQRGGGLLKMGP